MEGEAILSSEKDFTLFKYGGQTIRFRTPAKLERYTKIVEWDHGYIVVMVKYEGREEIEDYIDLIPILENLYYNPDEFLKEIKKVRIEYAA